MQPKTRNNTASQAHTDNLVAVGRVLKPRGIRGEIKVEILTDFPERFARSAAISLERGDGRISTYEIEGSQPIGTAVFLKLKGIDDRNAAEALRGAYVSVPREENFPLDENSFYAYDLEGMEVRDSADRKIGRIIGIEQYPANDVLIVETDRGAVMLPAVKAYILEVDTDTKTMIVEMPDDLPLRPSRSG